MCSVRPYLEKVLFTIHINIPPLSPENKDRASRCLSSSRLECSRKLCLRPSDSRPALNMHRRKRQTNPKGLLFPTLTNFHRTQRTQPNPPSHFARACAFPALAGIVMVDKPRVMQSPVLSREEELYWLALKLVPGLGSRTSGKLLDRFRTPAGHLPRLAHGTRRRRSLRAPSPNPSPAAAPSKRPPPSRRKWRSRGAVAVTIGDPRYPQPLREIFDPPILLFARGRVELLQTICLGVVGTRRPTPYGLAVAERLSGDLAHAGLTIVSGMARGIDSAAHKGALARGGNTIAVLGCGVDVVYPSENRKLAAELAARGLIVSEFPMGAVAFPAELPHPQPHHQRNQRRRPGRRGCPVLRFGHHRQARHRPGPRSLRRPRQHHLQAELGP